MGKAVLTCSCGGTIVSNHYVVTAAHCVFSCVVDRNHVALKTIEMHTNLRSSSLNSAYRGQSKFSVADNIVVHPGFGGQAETVINDIALLHSPDDLLQMIKYKTWMQTMPACLPTADLCANDGAHVRVSGFGKTEYKADSTGRFNLKQLKENLECVQKSWSGSEIWSFLEIFRIIFGQMPSGNRNF